MSSSSFEWENRASSKQTAAPKRVWMIFVLRRSPRERERERKREKEFIVPTVGSSRNKRREREETPRNNKQDEVAARVWNVRTPAQDSPAALEKEPTTNNKTWQIGWNYLRTRRSSVGAVQTHAPHCSFIALSSLAAPHVSKQQQYACKYACTQGVCSPETRSRCLRVARWVRSRSRAVEIGFGRCHCTQVQAVAA